MEQKTTGGVQDEVENISVTATQEAKLRSQLNEIASHWDKADLKIEQRSDKDY
jgi:hypothetical protein